MKKILIYAAVAATFFACKQAQKHEVANETKKEVGTRWTVEEAEAWSKKMGWMTGGNFQPSTAINQLEMWQAETFDPETMDRELGYAESIGFNAMRVYLHHVAWEQDKQGFKNRVKQYLSIADKHGIKTIFVFFDDCWNATYVAGTQPEPKTGIHNSGWVQDPGPSVHGDTTMYPLLESYVKDVLTEFSGDERIAIWDLYNEPGNSGYGNKSMPLLKKVFEWAREVDPTQPISAGFWNIELKELNAFQLAHSDITTYHNYMDPKTHQSWIDSLKTYGRPMVCTEYMARTNGNTFLNTLPMLKREGISAINWGLVSGKTNTIYAWDTPVEDGSEPETWFHDVFRKDGTPYSEEEVNLIKELNEKVQ
ncbi:1,4-beta-xylanase [Limibacter armeniacum]|uniref:1,4-beta-xylanase n=1 Tax=Limibacter armeniacum TaxID=466084 RepID=UPI002FE58A96